MHRLILLITILFAACSASPALPTPTATLLPPTVTPTLPPPSATPTVTLSPTPILPTATLEPQAGGQSAGDPYMPEIGNTGYDVLHYDLAFAIDPAARSLEAQANLNIAASLTGLPQFSLDFAGFELSAVHIDGQSVTYTRLPEQEKLVIDLPRPFAAGEQFAVQINYFGLPEEEPSTYVPFIGHLGIFYLGAQHTFTLSEPDGAHHWFPSNDHPTDKATYSYEITVPAGLTAIANGELIETRTTADGRQVYLWQHEYPLASYLAAVVIGEYDLLESISPDGIPLRSYIFSDLRTQFEPYQAITAEAIDWMSTKFGLYPFEAFGFVTIRTVSAASETQTMVILSEYSINEETIVHEIAHMWFGNWVSLASWGDVWLKEGLAVYISLLWQTRHDPAALNAYFDNMQPRILAESGDYPLDEAPNNLLYGYASYQRGALVQHRLHRLLGDEAYFSGLRRLVETYGGRTVTQAEFQAVMEAAYGAPLDAFFAEWLD